MRGLSSLIASTATILLLLETPVLVHASVQITEVADKGTPGACDGTESDWVELHNTASSAVSLAGWILSDDKGAEHADAHIFPSGASIGAGEYKLLCNNKDTSVPDSFVFGIGGTDEVKLFDATGNMVDTSGTLGGEGALGKVWARKADGTFAYTTSYTPGAANQSPGGSSPATSAPTLAVPTTGVRLSEVADKGSADACNGADWIELENIGTSSVDLQGYTVNDEQGPSSAEALTFGAGTSIPPAGFKLLCSSDVSSDTTFAFGIGGQDIIQLWAPGKASLLDTTGALGGSGEYGRTWARSGTGEWASTYTPTPGAPNTISATSIATSSVEVNEVADKGSAAGTCREADWVELYNAGSAAADLAGYVVADSGGPAAAEAYTFPSGSSLAAGGYLVLCGGDTFAFGIGGKDEIALWSPQGSKVHSSGKLGGAGQIDQTWAQGAEGTWEYTTTPTPEAANIFTTAAPTFAPTDAPTDAPTATPTAGPTGTPTVGPTAGPAPAPVPTSAPTAGVPTAAPTAAPASSPTSAPASTPTSAPAVTPTTAAPTAAPATTPTSAPAATPTSAPTDSVSTGAPTAPPTDAPTSSPASAPTAAGSPTGAEPSAPTGAPTEAEAEATSSGQAPMYRVATRGMLVVGILIYSLLAIEL